MILNITCFKVHFGTCFKAQCSTFPQCNTAYVLRFKTAHIKSSHNYISGKNCMTPQSQRHKYHKLTIKNKRNSSFQPNCLITDQTNTKNSNFLPQITGKGNITE